MKRFHFPILPSVLCRLRPLVLFGALAFSLFGGTLFAQSGIPKDIEADADIRQGIRDLEQGNFFQAITLLEKGLSRLSKHEKGVLSLALAYGKTGQPEKALRSYQNLLNITGRKDVALCGMANAQILLGKYDEALKSAQTARTFNPQNPEVFQLEGMAYLRLDRLPEAFLATRHTLELSPTNENALKTLTEIAFRQSSLAWSEPPPPGPSKSRATPPAISNSGDTLITDCLGIIEEYLKRPDAANREIWTETVQNLKEAADYTAERRSAPKGIISGKVTPARLLNTPRPLYTDAARDHKTRGTVRLTLFVNSKGKVAFVTWLNQLPHGLTDSAIQAVQKAEFQPAMRDGKPVPTTVRFEINFDRQ